MLEVDKTSDLLEKMLTGEGAKGTVYKFNMIETTYRYNIPPLLFNRPFESLVADLADDTCVDALVLVSIGGKRLLLYYSTSEASASPSSNRSFYNVNVTDVYFAIVPDGQEIKDFIVIEADGKIISVSFEELGENGHQSKQRVAVKRMPCIVTELLAHHLKQLGLI